MNNVYAETVSLCPECAKESPAYYMEKKEGMFLVVECAEHGPHGEKAESDIPFFKKGYEQEYKKDLNHLVFPITYHCNLKCTYCYTLSNSALVFPEDRTAKQINAIMKNYDGNVTLIGGEPTLRSDLTRIIATAKKNNPDRKISIGTNGQKLGKIEFVKELKDSGLDFVFLSCNDSEYEISKKVQETKQKALENCHKLKMPVWLNRTIDRLQQMDSLEPVLETYKKIIFKVTVRAVKPFGTYYPLNHVSVSDILKYIGRGNNYMKGRTPFNRHLRMKGIKVKVCSWINDVKRIDPIDSDYIISDNTITGFHRGMKVDELLLKGRNLAAVK